MASKGGKKKKNKKGKAATPTTNSAPKQSEPEVTPVSSKPTTSSNPAPQETKQQKIPQETDHNHEEDDEEIEESDEPEASEKKKNKKKKKKKKKKTGSTTSPSATTPPSATSPPKSGSSTTPTGGQPKEDDKPKQKKGQVKDKQTPKPLPHPAPKQVAGKTKERLTDEEKKRQLQELIQKMVTGNDLKQFDRTGIKDIIKENFEQLKKTVLPTATFKPVQLSSSERAEKKAIWKQKYTESAAQVGVFMKQRTPDAKEDTERLVSDLKRLVDEHNPDPPQPPSELQQALYDSSVALFSSRDAQYWRIVPYENDWRVEIYITSGRRFDCPAPLKPFEKKIKIIATGLPEIPL